MNTLSHSQTGGDTDDEILVPEYGNGNHELFSATFSSPGETIQAPNIPYETLVFGKKLGSGTFGSVYKGSVRGVVVAIKVLKINSVNIEDLLQEVGIMSHLRFSNIVTMHGVCFHSDNLYIISEFLPCGDLEQWLSDKNKEIGYLTKIKLLKDVAMAMNWLHASDPIVIHRDLKPANVLLTTSRRPGDEETLLKENRFKEIEKDLMAKVTDMGLSKVINSRQQLKADGAGSNLWMAPELLKYQYYDKKVDCYSFALLIWQILTWTQNPFQDYLDRGDLDLFVEAVYYHRVRPSIPPTLKVHPKLIQLMNAGWAHVPKERPDFSEFAMGLDDCLISTLFKDDEYANFWKQNWGARIIYKEQRVQPAKEVIPWATFIQAFYEYLKKYGITYPVNPDSDVYYLSLKAIAIDPSKHDAVSLERFLLIEKWFGPLSPPRPISLVSVAGPSSASSPSLPTLSLPIPTLDPPSSRKSPTIKSSRTETKQRTASTLTARRESRNNSPISRSISSENPKSTNSPGRKETKITSKEEMKISSSSKDKQPQPSTSSAKEKLPSSSGKNSPLAKKETPPRASSGKDEVEGEKKLQRGRVNRSRTRSQIGKKKAAPPPESPRRELSHSERRRRLSRTKSGRQRTLSKLPRARTSMKLEEKKERPEERTILGSIKRILEQTWFHGDITKEDADSTLATNKTIEGHKIFGSHGDFLIRASFSEPVEQHPFTITKVNKKGAIFHHRIFYNEAENRYTVYTKTDQYTEVSGDSLISLVKQLMDLKIVTQPCKRWNYARKYADIFEKKLSEDHGYVDTDELSSYLENNNHPKE